VTKSSRISRDARTACGTRKILSEVVTERIRNLIVDAGLKTGDRLPTEHELARRFGVSRICVREATKALGFLGIIHSRPRRGLVVGKVDLDRVTQYLGFHLALGDYPLVQLLEARVVVETGALPYTMRRIASDRALYEGLLEKARLTEATVDPDLFIERDVAFHRALLAASGIEALVVFNDLLEIFFRRFRESVLSGELRKGSRSHRKMLELLAAGKCEEAQALLRAHIAWHERSATAAAPRARRGAPARRLKD
jgi:GntR family transcriptional regulator, transcriptional repressor for pyruvate dehydrogenase complex